MAYLGLVPSEHSSGGTRRQGGITRTGNRHARWILVEAAWNYRFRPCASKRIGARRQLVAAGVRTIAEKAEQRLARRFRKLIDRGKSSQKAVTAVARELVGFV
jgi:transposase